MNKLKLFQDILKEHNLDFIFKDRLGILTRRKYFDNIEYILNTKNSCDALPMMEALDDMIKCSKISIDIGANIGITSIWLAKNSEKVYAFEPEQNNIKRFKEQIILNEIDNVQLSECVVSNSSEKRILHLFESYGHHSLSPIHVSKNIGEISVDSITLDDFCYRNNLNQIDCLKVDVEGFEMEVFQGCEKLLKNKSIKLIIFEHSPLLINKQQKDIEEVIKYLKEFGYKIFNLNHEEIFISDIKNLEQQDLYSLIKD